MDDNLQLQIQEKYGEPVIYNENSVTLNPLFFSAYFHARYKIGYDSLKKQFSFYLSEGGNWVSISEVGLYHKIEEFLLDFFQSDSHKNQIIAKCSSAFIGGIIKSLAGRSEMDWTARPMAGYPIHCANTMIEWNNDTWQKCPFSEHYLSKHRSSIIYDPQAQCPKFLERLLKPAMTGSDIELLQLYFGQCLLGTNLSQTFLLLTGTAGGGKSTLVNVIEGIVGRHNCTELRTGFLNGRFEISRTYGKTLLTAKDVPGDFLSTAGAQRLKALTGADMMTLEYKNSNETKDLAGTFNAIITSNTLLRLHFDGDEDAWCRRLRWIRYDRPPTTEKIVNFDQQLLKEEGSGILNWALAGASALLRNHGKLPCDEEQVKRINYLMASSKPLDAFVRDHVISDADHMVTTEDLVHVFKQYCDKMKWPPLPTRVIERELPEAMRRIHAAQKRNDILVKGKFRRGYKYFRIIQVFPRV